VEHQQGVQAALHTLEGVLDQAPADVIDSAWLNKVYKSLKTAQQKSAEKLS